jgi:hypothetical protein
MPTDIVGQDAVLGKASFGGIEDLIIRTGNFKTFDFEGDSQIMHSAAPDSDKMYFHIYE